MVGVVIAAIAVSIVAVVALTVAMRSSWERSMHRRLDDVLTRLHVDPSTSTATTDEQLARIERAVRSILDDAATRTRDEARWRAALDGVPHAVLLFDQAGVFLDANVTAEPVVRARHGDALVGAAINDLVADAVATGRARTALELFGPPRRFVEIVAVRLDGDAGVVATVEDVTDRRHLEEVRTDLVANISHELKTPVGAIGLLAETLEQERDPVVIDRLVGRIGAEAGRLAAIVDDLLDLSRIEASPGVGGRTASLADVVAEVVDRFGAAADRAGVGLVVRPTAGDVRVTGDHSQLVSALANLVGNAVKYSDRGSTVELSVSIDGHDAVLAVSDEGMGIPARDLDRIFERFYRVDQARSRDTGGSGLGLSIVRHVAINHGGRVDVQSRLGEGSTFSIVLPVIGVDDASTATGEREDA